MTRIASGAKAYGSREEEVTAYLMQEIVSGKYAPGQFLPSVRELAERFHVSRTPIHMAFQQLAKKGLLEVNHGSGTRVLAKNGRLNARNKPLVYCVEDFSAPTKGNLLQKLAISEGIRFQVGGFCGADKEFREKLKDAIDLSPQVLVFARPTVFSDEAKNLLLKLRRFGVHVVHDASEQHYTEFDRVHGDFEGGQYQLTRHALEQGHRKILRWGNPLVWSDPLKQKGFCRALSEGRVEMDTANLWSIADRKWVEAKDKVEYFIEALPEFLEKHRPSLMMAPDDGVGIILQEALRKLKIKNVDVYGYGNTWGTFPGADRTGKPLVTVDTNEEKTEETLVELALGRATGAISDVETQCKIIPHDLLVSH